MEQPWFAEALQMGGIPTAFNNVAFPARPLYSSNPCWLAPPIGLPIARMRELVSCQMCRVRLNTKLVCENRSSMMVGSLGNFDRMARRVS